MKYKCTLALLALGMMSISSLALAKFGIPAQHYKVTYQYHLKNGSDWVQIGEKTYHCDGSVTQWGNTSGKSQTAMFEPICD